MKVERGHREQMDMLAELNVTVEGERTGKGSHLVVYCVGPAKQRFVLTLCRRLGDPRARKNFRQLVIRKLSA